MELASNIARKDTAYRKGQGSFVSHTFEEYSRLCDKSIPQYCTWYSYEEGPLFEFVSANEWSIKGFHATKPPLYFDFIPFDFDADTILKGFEASRKFLDWLLGQGIPESHFSIWLSGSKGFHIEVDRTAFDISSPSQDVLRRLKSLVERLIKVLDLVDYDQKPPKAVLDISLYSAGRLYRNHNSKHAKTGLHKTRISLANFTWEHLEKREEWAAEADGILNSWTHLPLETPLNLPLVEIETVDAQLAPDMVVDTSLSIIGKCPRIRGLMKNPEGRELRRQAAAVLMEAYGTSGAPEVSALYAAWEGHPHMDSGRWADADKWRAEFEKDGHIKCNKTCTGMGCERPQKRICGTQAPADHLVSSEPINPISVEEGRAHLKDAIRAGIYADGIPITVIDMPVGLGKTTEVIQILAEDEELRAFMAVPTHALGKEVADKMEEAGIDSLRVIKSRPRLIRERVLDCLFPNEVNVASDLTNGTTTKICTKCPKFPKKLEESPDPDLTPCEYFAQYDGIEDIRVVVGAHQHINQYSLDRIGMDTRDVLIIDESPLKTFAEEVKAVQFDKIALLQGFFDSTLAILEAENSLPSPSPETKTTGEAGGGMFGGIRALAQMEEEAQLAAMTEEEYQAKQSRRVIASGIYAAIGLIAVGKQLPPASIQMLEAVKYTYEYNRFLNKLTEVGKFEPAAVLDPELRYVLFPDILDSAIKCSKVGLPYDLSKTYFFSRLMPLVKTVILDATASKPLYQKMIEVTNREERELIYNSLPLVDQTHGEVIQVTNSGYSKTRIGSSEDVLDKLMFIPQSLANTYDEDRILCVSVMDLEKQMKERMPSRRTDTEHFGDMRGKDQYKDYPFEVIMGGFFVSNAAVIEGLQRFDLHSIDDEMLENNTIQIRYKHLARNGDTYFSKRKAFRSVYRGDAFYYANLLLEQASTAEVVQATRVRLFSGEKEKKIYIVTNIGLSRMYADRFVTIEELTAELEDESGLKSELDTTKNRRDAVMVMTLNRMKIGEEFTLEDIHKDEKTARNFLYWYQTSGSVERVGKGAFKKVAKLDDSTRMSQSPKETSFLLMDKWLAGLKNNTDFTVMELSDIAGTSSIRYLREWIKIKMDTHQIRAIGQNKGRFYRKVQKMTAGIMKLL